MTAQDIIDAIVKMQKDGTPEDVWELLASRAILCDLPMIRAALEDHKSSNERNAANDACDWIDAKI